MAQETNDNVIDLNREVSIMFLKSTPGFAIRTPRGQKDPGSVHWDPKANSREKSNEAISVIQRTTDNLGVHLFGPVVDVDVDTDNPTLVAALDHFLPHTNHIWGRKSRPRTHRLYELTGANSSYDPEEYPFLKKIAGHDDLKVEIRGGDLKAGQYSILPGSIHPSGEAYEWSSIREAKSTPVHVDLERIADAVRFACVCALIVPYWQEGMRNEMCKGLSGFMHRAASYTEELNVGLTFDRDKAQRLLDGIMKVAEDDPADFAMRQKTFDQTWEKADNGDKVLGATHIKNITGDERIVPLLYTLLAYTPDLMQLEEMFEQYAVIRNTTSIIDLNLGARGNYVMNKDAFMFTMSGRFLMSPKGRVPVASVFINSMQRTIVDKVGISPAQGKVYEDTEGFKIANVWSGWGIDPCEEDVDEKDVQVFLNYIMKVVANENEPLYEWIIMWLADIFQNPDTKPGTALVLVGRQGAGKSFLFENILRPIIGEAHFAKAGTTDRLTSKFNNHMGGKLFIQGEEVVNSNRRMDAEALKDAITSSKRTIEMKGRDSFEMEDYARYGFTSNHTDNAVNISVGDRRYTIALVSSDYSFYENLSNEGPRTAFWSTMFKWAQSKDDQGRVVPNRHNLSRLHKFFLGVQVERAKIRYAFDTAIKRATLANSNRGMDGWLMAMIECINPFDVMRENERGEGHSFRPDAKGCLRAMDGWPTYVSYSILEQCMRQFTAKEYGEARSAQQIAKYFKDKGIIPDTNEKKVRHSGGTVRIRPFPSRAAIHSYLKEQGYQLLDLPEDEEEEEKPEREEF